MKKLVACLIMILGMSVLAGCQKSSRSDTQAENQADTSDELENGVSAIEDAMEKGNTETSAQQVEDGNDLRNGTSANTVATPKDFPEEYNYGSGKISDYSRDQMLKKLPEPDGEQTVLNTKADAENIQVLYLWEKGNVPAKTEFTENMTGYFDNWDFRPYVTAIPVRPGVKAKGAVVLMAGGAYQFRGNYTDALPTAAALREQGFDTFIVDYRLSPYTQEEGALDVARAVRFIRENADIYGINPDAIAVMGFSAGGIQAGEFLMHYDEAVDGTALDADYKPDELDQIPAHASAAAMIYSFYGRLSVGNMDADWLAEGDLPPTYYVYGTEDPFYDQFERQYEVIREMGIPTGRIVLNGWPHGFGSDGGWVEDYAAWLEEIFRAESGTDEKLQNRLTEGTEEYKGFQMDNVLHSDSLGEIHYHIYVPDSYDGSESYALYVTLPGYEGLYFQGVGENLRSENFAFEALNYNDKMIIAAPQLDDWGETSANKTVELVRFLLDYYNIDTAKVYADGYSGGGETMSLVLEKAPELFTAYLHCSSKWDGDFSGVIENRIPIYFVIGENDEYYGSEPTKETYEEMHRLYEKEGLTDVQIGKLLVLDVKEHGYFTAGGISVEHGGGVLFAQDENIMGWLFSQEK